MTTDDIRALRTEAAQAGDLRMVVICDLAIHGPSTLDGAEPGTEAALLRDEGHTQTWARETCADAIANAHS